MEQRIIEGCLGERYLGCGLGAGSRLVLKGTPGNAAGAYLDGGEIEIFGNAQDAVGDTMNGGVITVHGNIGDAAGYAMRGGEVYVEGNAGYRAGVHMKEYRERVPALVVGGVCGSFLGEYQAGGVIVVMGLGARGGRTVGDFCAAGMHGGRIYLRTETPPDDLPAAVRCKRAESGDIDLLSRYVEGFCERFGGCASSLLCDVWQVITPDSANPYKKLYVFN